MDYPTYDIKQTTGLSYIYNILDNSGNDFAWKEMKEQRPPKNLHLMEELSMEGNEYNNCFASSHQPSIDNENIGKSIEELFKEESLKF